MTDPKLYKAEVDFRYFFRRFENFFSLTYIFFLVAVVCLGILYVKNLTTVGKNSVIPVAADSSLLVQDIPLVMPSVLPPVDVVKAGTTSPGAIEHGHDLFRANCVACHGDEGLGDGPTAPTLNPKPRNFHSLEGWKNGRKVSQIYKTLQDGIPGGGMASYSYLPPADRFALVHFVRTLAPNPPTDTPDDLQQLETTYQLSKGVDRPGQIPVRKAARLVIGETRPSVDLVGNLVTKVDNDVDSKGARLFRTAASDERRAMVGLVLRGRAYRGPDEFVHVVSADPLLFGLKPGVSALSADDWAVLYNYVLVLRASI